MVNQQSDHSVEWIKPSAERFEGIRTGRYHISACYRLALPELLDVEHVIYLDADTLVLSCPSVIWDNAVLSEWPAAGIKDHETRSLAEESEQLAEAVNKDDNLPYFNSGVLFLDLVSARHHNLTTRLLNCLRETGHLARFPDQSAINICLSGQIQPLANAWNLPAWKFDESTDNNLPNILHHTNNAPWLQRHYRPSQALFERVAKELGVPLPKPEKGLPQTITEALCKWLIAPARVVWHGIKAYLAERSSDTTNVAKHLHIMRYWLRYFTGGPERVIRYHRRIREIRSPSVQIFPGSNL